MEGLGRAQEAIRKAKTIAIAGHVNPDGDSIGSLLSLGLGLERLGKRVSMVSVDGVPHRYRILPGAHRIVQRLKRPVDLAITVDCSSREILGSTYDDFIRSGDLLEIDHHDFRRPFGTIALIDATAASVGEIVYTLLKRLRAGITKEIAQNLMTSIIVETNSFRLPTVKPFTFEVCTDLINKGVDFYKLVDAVFWSMGKAAAILSGTCLGRCRFAKRGRIAWSVVTMEDFARTGGKDEDVDAVPDEMRAIRDVRVAVLFREKSKKTLRVSLRSKGRINVAAVAEHYNGGGHFDVAGCTIENSPDAMNDLMKRVRALVG